MRLKHMLMIAGCLLMITACTNKSMENTVEPQKNQDQGLELSKIKANSPVDQQVSNQAKQMISDHDKVKSVRAVNHDHQLLIGVQLNHHDRIDMDDIERKLQKEIRKKFTDYKVNLSTDEKIHLEVEKLEKALQERKLSKKELKKKIKKVKSLSKEKT